MLVNKLKELYFVGKYKNPDDPPLVFSNAVVSQTNSQKHLGVTLDLKSTLEEHVLNAFKKFNRTIDLLRKLQRVLLRTNLVTIYKAFSDTIWIMRISYTTKILTILSTID